MRPAPFWARWQAGPLIAGAFEARLRLDDESLFAGHYPGAPIFPGTFLVEALFQAASVALGGGARLVEIVACRFHSPLFPGDEVVAQFSMKDAGAGATLVEATAQGRAPASQVTMLIASCSSPVSVGPPPMWKQEQTGPTTHTFDAAFIQRALPHRPPALLVDNASLVGRRPGAAGAAGAASALIARKRITTNERCYAGAEGLPLSSYPMSPMLPRSLIVESFCQSCGLLRAATAPDGERRDPSKVPVVAKLAKLRFTGDVGPGDVLEHHVELVTRLSEGAVFSGETVVAERVVLRVGRVVAAMASLT